MSKNLYKTYLLFDIMKFSCYNDYMTFLNSKLEQMQFCSEFSRNFLEIRIKNLRGVSDVEFDLASFYSIVKHEKYLIII